jgi:hypothetical protein
MADSRSRDLERAAAGGDHEAAERLYWETLRVTSGSHLLDRLIEEVITLRTRRAPSVWDKLNWVRGTPQESLSPEQLATLHATWRQVEAVADLHRVPRIIRQDGFTVYCRDQGQVFEFSKGIWNRLADLSRPPPGFPFTVYRSIRERDEKNPSPPLGSSCLVLENGGVYRAESSRSTYQPHRNVWASIRFERTSA